jgi:ABC-2 type transport system ATP-binding protein
MPVTTEISNLAIDLINVEKTYRGGVRALKGVNIQVGQGEIFGLLGPNGAGKTTLVKIMMTAVRPDKLIGTILGRPVGHIKKKALIGYLPEQPRFSQHLTGRQMLEHYAALGLVDRNTRKRRASELLSKVSLQNKADIKIRHYSKGMIQRIALAQALMNKPELLVLDEPTDGLDPLGRRQVREMLIALKQTGTTVFLNSHLISELEMICDRVAILVDGLVARQGTLSELTEQTISYRIRLATPTPGLEQTLKPFNAAQHGNDITIEEADIAKLNELIDKLRAKNAPIESIHPKRFTLEDVFVDTLGRENEK